jgi:hypothetical protein
MIDVDRDDDGNWYLVLEWLLDNLENRHRAGRLTQMERILGAVRPSDPRCNRVRAEGEDCS